MKMYRFKDIFQCLVAILGFSSVHGVGFDWSQTSQYAYIKASNTEAGDQFAWSIGFDGATLVVAARAEASCSPTNQENNDCVVAGAAYIYEPFSVSWAFTTYVKPPLNLIDNQDGFADGVDVDGDFLAVGFSREDSCVEGVDNGWGLGSCPNSGAAIIYWRNKITGLWEYKTPIKPEVNSEQSFFGNNVKLDGNTLVVSAMKENGCGSGINGTEDTFTCTNAGAVHVYVRTNTWARQAYIKAHNAAANDRFGISIDLSGDFLVVGASQQRSCARGIDAFDSNDPMDCTFSGAAYIFERSGQTWSQTAFLKAPNADINDGFGTYVAIDGNVVAVGAKFEDSCTEMDMENNDCKDSGAVYLYERVGSDWHFSAYLKPYVNSSWTHFGKSVALYGGTLAVGTRDASCEATDEFVRDTSCSHSGSVHVFSASPSGWERVNYLKADIVAYNASFGDHVVLYEDTLVVGANYESSCAELVNAAHFDTACEAAGAAYLFKALPRAPSLAPTLAPTVPPNHVIVSTTSLAEETESPQVSTTLDTTRSGGASTTDQSVPTTNDDGLVVDQNQMALFVGLGVIGFVLLSLLILFVCVAATRRRRRLRKKRVNEHRERKGSGGAGSAAHSSRSKTNIHARSARTSFKRSASAGRQIHAGNDRQKRMQSAAPSEAQPHAYGPAPTPSSFANDTSHEYARGRIPARSRTSASEYVPMSVVSSRSSVAASSAGGGVQQRTYQVVGDTAVPVYSRAPAQAKLRNTGNAYENAPLEPASMYTAPAPRRASAASSMYDKLSLIPK